MKATVTKRRNSFPLPLVVAISLLLVEVIVYGGFFTIGILDLDPSWLRGSPERVADYLLTALSTGVLLLPAIAGLVAVINTLRRGRNAWNNVMLTQGLVLAIAFISYFALNDRSFVAYAPMAYALILVVYLMVPGVQAAFLPMRGKA